MKFNSILLFILIKLSLLTNLGAQDLTKFSGKIVDKETKEPLIGATIRSKEDKSVGTVTDIEGKFVFSANSSIEVFEVSYTGYESKDIDASSQTIFEVQLERSLEILEEIVVIGYGEVKKSDVTGSVASVRKEEFNPGPVISVSNQLQNTAPGVLMTQTSAQPGGNFSVQVRGQTSILGSSEPLYVLDGFPISNDNVTPGSGSIYRSSPSRNPLNSINPEDIVSIEILKDASAAAIYGARGANGVVLITTKKGSQGNEINYSASYSVQDPINNYQLLNGSEYAVVSNEFSSAIGQPLIYSAAEVNSFGEGTDWNEELTNTGTIQRHQLSFNGKNDQINYYLSGNYFNHQGVIRNTGLERFSGRINLEVSLSDKLKLGTNTTLSQTNDSQVHFSGSGGPETNGLFDITQSWPSNIPVFDSEGNFSVHPVIPTQAPNPVSLLEISDELATRRMLSSFYSTYAFTNALKGKINIGLDDVVSKRTGYIPLNTLRGEQVDGEGDISQNQTQNFLAEATLTYNKSFGQNSFSALIGNTYQQFSGEGFGTTATGFASQTTNINDLGGASVFLPSRSYRYSSRLISYLSRFNFDLNGKVLFTATFRADGSTKFGENNKWGYFPSGAVAWKIHEESFFDFQAVNELKLRLSYGLTGNQEIGNKLSQSLYSSTKPFILGKDGNLSSGLAPSRPENQNLKWETTTQFNLGLDISLFKARVQSSIDLYQKITTDVLLNFPLPGTSGFESITTNAGSLQNQGIELKINTVNLESVVEWSSIINFAYNRNSWKDRAGLPFAAYEQEFGPVQGLYAFVVDGVWQQDDDIAGSYQPESRPGQFRFADIDGDGDITPDDRTLIGSQIPSYTLGLNNSIKYNDFDLSFFFQGVFDVMKFNSARANLNNVNDILFGRNKSVKVLNRWTPENPSNSISSGIVNTVGDDFYNSQFIEDASFIRLRNITLGYSPKIKFFNSFRIYADIQNLITLTDWTGLDPETGEEYPNSITYSLGLNVTFK
jgi:TonB-linked SusC/RagA family outer membrane protein